MQSAQQVPMSINQPEMPMNINQLQSFAMNVVANVCSIFTMPVEIILRPHYGTRYFAVPIVFFSAILMVILPLFSSAADSVVSMIPFSAPARPPAGLFSIGSLSSLYFFLVFLHGFRLWRRMIHMELEEHSEFEGPPLPFFHLIPGGRSFWFTRIVIEPVFVFILATLLEGSRIFQSGLATYLHIAALMLAMKNFICWYRAWEYVRKLMDARHVSPIIAKLLENKATEDDLAPIHLASFPKTIGSDLRQAAASHIARSFSAGTQASPSFPEKAGSHE
jgi:hypothetical protein